MTDHTCNGVQQSCTEVHPTVNGWTNHATWLVNLWLGEYNYDPSELSGLSRYDAVQALKDTVDNMVTDYGSNEPKGFVSDLINSALADVNWYEVADHFLEDLPEEDDSNDDSDD